MVSSCVKTNIFRSVSVVSNLLPTQESKWIGQPKWTFYCNHIIWSVLLFNGSNDLESQKFNISASFSQTGGKKKAGGLQVARSFLDELQHSYDHFRRYSLYSVTPIIFTLLYRWANAPTTKLNLTWAIVEPYKAHTLMKCVKTDPIFIQWHLVYPTDEYHTDTRFPERILVSGVKCNHLGWSPLPTNPIFYL